MYGLNKDIKNYIDKNIEKNKTFLKNLTFYNEDYKLVSMFDSDLNANLSPQRYFAEVNNRVHTLFAVAKELELVPAFLTVTLPSCYHPSSENYNGSTPKQSALYLSDIWAKFLRKKIFANIKKNTGTKMIYIRVYEPHKSGVPHLHAMVFIPKAYLSQVKSKFYEHYTKYSFKKVGLKFMSNFKHAKYEEAQGAIAYILKYMNKTFKHAKDNKMTDEAYYFAYHGIRRFITSQTLIPLWIYRKIKHNENTRDLYKLTKQYVQGNIYTCFNKEYIVQRYIHTDVEKYEDEIINIEEEVREKVIYQKNHFISSQFKVSKKHYEPIPKSFKGKQQDYVPIFTNGALTHIYNPFKKDIVVYKKHITQMTDLELYQYYKNYDIETESYVHYLGTRNYMIQRGLLSGETFNLSEFKFVEFFF